MKNHQVPLISLCALVVTIGCTAEQEGTRGRGPNTTPTQTNVSAGAAGAGDTATTGGGAGSAAVFDNSTGDPGGNVGSVANPVPGAGGTGEFCVAGLYAGTYTLMLNAAFPGNIDIELEPGESIPSDTLDGVVIESFTIVDGGELYVQNVVGQELRAPLEGGVNCETGEFTGGTIDIGNPAPWSHDCMTNPPGGCGVELTGVFDPAAGTITGEVHFYTELYGQDTGPFEITLAP